MAALDKDYTLEIKWGLVTNRKRVPVKIHYVVINGRTRFSGSQKDCKAFAYDYMRKYPLSNHDDTGYNNRAVS